MKTSFNGHNFYNLFKPLPFLVSDVHFWLWHRCFLRVSPKPSSFGCIFLLWHRCFPLDFTGALFCVSTRNSMKLQILFELCEYLFVLVANRTFLPEFLMLNISFGCCRHSVSNTFVQLTEGRSARDQPKQPPAKKRASLWRLFALFYAVFASPSQDKLSGIWGGCSFTFHTFHTFHLRDWNCLRVFLALLLWRKLGFPTKTSFHGHQPL